MNIKYLRYIIYREFDSCLIKKKIKIAVLIAAPFQILRRAIVNRKKKCRPILEFEMIKKKKKYYLQGKQVNGVQCPLKIELKMFVSIYFGTKFMEIGSNLRKLCILTFLYFFIVVVHRNLLIIQK